MDSAITRPPLSARMARPSRESSRLCSSHSDTSSTAQISTPMARGEASETPATMSGGMPVMPVCPPRNSMLPNR